MKVSEYSALDATALAELVRKKEVSPLEVLDTAIEAIRQVNPAVNGWWMKPLNMPKHRLMQVLIMRRLSAACPL